MLLICLKIACEPITIYNNNIDVMGQLTSNKCVVKLSQIFLGISAQTILWENWVIE